MLMKILAVLVLLPLLLVGAAFSNYQRNAPLDEELRNRPYKSISDKDLAALLEAYKGEMQGFETRMNRFSKDRTKVMDGFAPADYDGKVRAFESFQRKNESWRDANRARLGHVVELEKLEHEKSIRDRGLHIEKNRILRRITTF